MTGQERYETIDLPFYFEKIAPILPPQVLDFHAHTWDSANWMEVPWDTGASGAQYMVSLEHYGPDRLLSDGKTMFPDRPYIAVCFGAPTPAADMRKENEFVAKAGRCRGLFSLLIAGRNLVPIREIERLIRQEGFLGYKVFLNWYGDNYADVRVQDMLGPTEMSLADELGLIVLLHVPGARRLADPRVQEGVAEWSEKYPGVRIVLAHCGRAYHPDEMSEAIAGIVDLENVYMDTSMVMEPQVLEMVLKTIDSRRVLFGTDFPIAAMRGRRVYVMDHWVDLVLEGYPPSGFRVSSNNMRATFMAWEIVLAIKRAGQMVNLPEDRLRAIFYDNGTKVLEHVMDGQQIKKIKSNWSS